VKISRKTPTIQGVQQNNTQKDTLMLLWQAARHHAEELGQFFNPAKDHGLDKLTELAENRFEATILITPKLSPDVPDLVDKDTCTPPEIYINAREPRSRQRFLLAHSIGHLIERISIAEKHSFSFLEKRNNDYDLCEFFADEFAGALLMPEKPLMEVINNTESHLMAACMFDVSIFTVRKRLARIEKHKNRTNKEEQ
jgi:hypothetical protein